MTHSERGDHFVVRHPHTTERLLFALMAVGLFLFTAVALPWAWLGNGCETGACDAELPTTIRETPSPEVVQRAAHHRILEALVQLRADEDEALVTSPGALRPTLDEEYRAALTRDEAAAVAASRGTWARTARRRGLEARDLSTLRREGVESTAEELPSLRHDGFIGWADAFAAQEAEAEAATWTILQREQLAEARAALPGTQLSGLAWAVAVGVIVFGLLALFAIRRAWQARRFSVRITAYQVECRTEVWTLEQLDAERRRILLETLSRHGHDPLVLERILEHIAAGHAAAIRGSADHEAERRMRQLTTGR